MEMFKYLLFLQTRELNREFTGKKFVKIKSEEMKRYLLTHIAWKLLPSVIPNIHFID